MKTLLSILALLFSLLAPIFAQGNDLIKRPPISPWTIPVRAPDFARWQISFSSGATSISSKSGDAVDPSAPSASRPKQISITKTGKTYHIETLYDNGEALDQWWINGTQVTKRTNYPGCLLSFGGEFDVFGIDYSKSDFPEFIWIRPESYAGIQKAANGLECFVFTKSASKKTPDSIVWIDIKTNLPVQVVTEGIKQIYTFLQPPSAQLTPPHDVANEIAMWEQKKARLSRAAPRP